MNDQARWDEKHGRTEYDAGVRPATFLEERITLIESLLPLRGRALDLAAGAGRNSVFLAQHGFEVVALDVSPVGLALAGRLAQERGVEIQCEAVDLERRLLPEATYDLVVDFFYLQRSLFPGIVAALRPGGLLVFETFTVDHPTMRKDFLLGQNELLNAFLQMRVLFYEELPDPHSPVARLIAQKPQ